jgi:hypothetical protein
VLVIELITVDSVDVGLMRNEVGTPWPSFENRSVISGVLGNNFLISTRASAALT